MRLSDFKGELLLRFWVRTASYSAYSGYPELWILRYPALGTSDINYYSVSTAGTVGGKYPLLSIDGADGN
jgi:hypothetical protein